MPKTKVDTSMKKGTEQAASSNPQPCKC